ncbi:MAG: WYL domain-containing protein [Ignavibacteria bacterium]|nr:WYL domain-containing protein [Ignavibacteria bacterium]
MKYKKAIINKTLLKRLSIIDNEITKGCFPNKKKIADLLNVSEKTVQRDIDFMKTEYNAPVAFNFKKKGFYYSDNNFSLNKVTIDKNDFISLAVIEKILEQHKFSPYKKYFEKLYDKLSCIYNDKVSVRLNDLNDILHFSPSVIKDINEENFKLLLEALKFQKPVKIRYQSGVSKKFTDCIVNPYHIRNFRGDWYLIGYSQKDKLVSVYALERIFNIKIINKYFKIIGDFDVDEFFKTGYGMFEESDVYNVILKFLPEAAVYIREKNWHPTQKMTRNPDGSITVKMTVSNLEEVFHWILSYGRYCKIISPDELKDMMAKELKAVLKNYKKPSDS